jgi:Domain of unknown function DUF11
MIGCHFRLKFHQLLRSLGGVAGFFMAMMLAVPHAAAQGLNFNCDVVFYQVKNTTTVSQIVKFASVSGTITPTGVYAATKTPQMNSIGYNAVDNFIYGISAVTATPTFYRIGDTGYAAVGTIANSIVGGKPLTNGFQPTAGVFDAAGRYYFAGQGAGLTPTAIFRVDSIPLTGTVQVAHQYNLLPAAVPNMGDFDFNGAGSTSGLLLGATGNLLYRIQLTPNNSNPALGTASVSSVTIATVGNIGSAFYDAASLKFYVFDNAASKFWEIQNAEAGIPVVIDTVAPQYSGGPGPFAGVTGASPTDGTSCPISGTRRADLRIAKTDNITSIPTGGVTSYVITVANNGPYPANYSVIRDPAVTGLSKLSVSCAASAGPPTAICPPTLSVASLEAGLQIITFPPTTSLTFTVNAQVTQTAGNFVTNTATITPAADTTLITPTFTVAIDVNAVTVAATTVSSTVSFCPAGTTESLTNLVTNGDFSAAAPFATQAALLGVNAYTANSSSVSRWAGTATPVGGIAQNPFSGDSTRSVLGSNSWLLSNGKFTGSPNYSAWLQPVTGLVVGRVYQFMTYQSNAITVGTSSPTLPDLRLVVNRAGVTTTISASTPLATETIAGGGDRWRLVQGTFTATVSAVTLSIADFSAASATEVGAVAGISQATLRACNPASDVAVTKTNGTTTVITGGTTAYTITVANLTAGVNATNTLIVDPGALNLIKSTITCVFTAGSLCPTSLSILGLEGAGLTIPRVNALGTVTFRVFANVTGAPGNTATNVVTISGISYTDPNPANNQAQDDDFVRGTASLSISKSNAVNTVTAGGTTSYTVTVSLTAGAQVNGAIMKDPVAAGLSCTAVTCTAVVGATSCPSAASTTIAALQGAGIVLPSMSAPSSISFNVVCGVRATGV